MVRRMTRLLSRLARWWRTCILGCRHPPFWSRILREDCLHQEGVVAVVWCLAEAEEEDFLLLGEVVVVGSLHRVEVVAVGFLLQVVVAAVGFLPQAVVGEEDFLLQEEAVVVGSLHREEEVVADSLRLVEVEEEGFLLPEVAVGEDFLLQVEEEVVGSPLQEVVEVVVSRYQSALGQRAGKWGSEMRDTRS